jgi:hypothetical protein
VKLTLRNSILLFTCSIFLLISSACTSQGANPVPTGTYTVDLNPEDFVELVDNPYFPLIPATRWVYEGQGEDGLERIEIEVLSETRQVMGIAATVLHDTVYLDGEMIEDTYDWYAQDKQGNVWYLGEDVSNYEDGELVDKAGSWEAGLDGALPGICTPTLLNISGVYHEYYQGSRGLWQSYWAPVILTIPLGSFSGVVKQRIPLSRTSWKTSIMPKRHWRRSKKSMLTAVRKCFD